MIIPQKFEFSKQNQHFGKERVRILISFIFEALNINHHTSLIHENFKSYKSHVL